MEFPKSLLNLVESWYNTSHQDLKERRSQALSLLPSKCNTSNHDLKVLVNRHGRTGIWDRDSPTTKLERMLGSLLFHINIHGRKTCHNEKRKSFNSSILVRLSYKRACPAGHNKYRVVDAEPNGIIPPPPRRAMGPDRNCRQLNCPVPIAHRGGGSAEVALEAAFSYNCHGQTALGTWVCPQRSLKVMLGIPTLSYKKHRN